MASTSSLNLRKRLTGRETSEVFDLRCWTDIFPPSNWCRSSFNLSSSPVSAQCSLRKTTYSLHLMNTFKYGNSRAAIRIACPLQKTVYSPRYNAADILADKELGEVFHTIRPSTAVSPQEQGNGSQDGVSLDTSKYGLA